VSMQSMGIGPEASAEAKAAACAVCRRHASLIRGQFGFPGRDLAAWLTPEDYARADELLATARRDAPTELTVDGLEIGRASLYEFLLDRKRSNLDFTDAEWAQYRANLRNCLLSYLASKRIFDEFRPDRVVTFASLYSVIAACRLVANERKVPFYCMTGGPNISEKAQTLSISRDDSMAFLLKVIQRFDEIRDVPCDPRYLPKVTAHFRELFRGQSVFAYSSPMKGKSFDVRKHFGIRPDQRLLVAVMSSYDERFAAEQVKAIPSRHESVFRDQLEWIEKLVAYLRGRPDLFLLIRVHPREFPNKRDSAKSDHARKLEQLFHGLPPNVRVNWPADDVSLYDLAQETSVFLNAWSSVGKEMSLLGIPVVIFSKTLPFYPASINSLATSESDFFTRIEAALAEGWSFERIRRTFRWYTVEYGHSVLPIHEGYRRRSGLRPALWRRVLNKLLRPVFPSWQEWLDCKLRGGSLPEADPLLQEMVATGAFMPMDLPARAPVVRIDDTEETALIREELRRLLPTMFAKHGSTPLRRKFEELGVL
jgi:hypothetical protein